ncbi:M23 family metallopeptidase [Leeuwenhoekiella palythoae]|uniref:Peptidase M23-like protein n=1 Tax=Leeuwenhoekiella palythoae TaxID=573501 RepID=A0A1M5XHF6_9FLAO|nr:M23 family metallopeptidase [Leeuwenhoekiella palythoae]RXG30053.1 peptidase M23-like protein [Leeuwenhoekiella palythoae]SHH99305.1 Peptidase family M23 [Leeuwenhoekiella palythoae]
MKKSLLFFFGIAANVMFAQNEFPQDAFIKPLKIPTVFAGTFGELRSNHFHSGLDIKTQHRTGLEVVASASGYVSRIKVSHYGYGKALYITHPNGYTTVYGHLSKYGPAIDAYVKQKQYEAENYEVELFPNPDELVVTQGELVAYSGNTGGSGGPHLHFEIRDKNERPLNAQLFGIQAPDHQDPILKDLVVYTLSDSSHVNQSQKRQELRFTKQPDGTFLAEKIRAYGQIGFALGTIDQQDGANNSNGIYSIETSFNGEKYLEVKMDQFSFAETRYLNRMIDYELYEGDRKRVQKLFIERNNPLSIFTYEKNKGVIDLTQNGNASVYTIKVKDIQGNTSTLVVPITIAKEPILTPKEIKTTPYFVEADTYKNFEVGDWEVFIPEGAFYDDYYLDITANTDALHLDEDLIPVHKYIRLAYDVSAFARQNREKLYIGRVNYRGLLRYEGARLEDDHLTASINALGDFKVGIDTKPPKIQSLDFSDGKWISNLNEINFKITDEDTGIKSYRATINGKFALMEYEYKKNQLTYSFGDGISVSGANEFKLTVTDNVGNSTTFEATFYRK